MSRPRFVLPFLLLALFTQGLAVSVASPKGRTRHPAEWIVHLHDFSTCIGAHEAVGPIKRKIPLLHFLNNDRIRFVSNDKGRSYRVIFPDVSPLALPGHTNVPIDSIDVIPGHSVTYVLADTAKPDSGDHAWCRYFYRVEDLTTRRAKRVNTPSPYCQHAPLQDWTTTDPCTTQTINSTLFQIGPGMDVAD